MFKRYTFRVEDRSFKTSFIWPNGLIPSMRGDTSNAYFRAHRCAAERAGMNARETYVTRDDRPGERLGFGHNAHMISTTALYEINQTRTDSYFDYDTCSWKPLPYDEVVVALTVAKEMRRGNMVSA